MQCQYCEKRAVVFRQESGISVCRACFFKEISKKIFKTMARYGMLQPRDLCVVGFSGGKDSQVLLEHMVRYQTRKTIGVRPIALTIDEGIRGYRQESLVIAKKFCERWEVKHIVLSFKDVFGKSLDEIVATAEAQGNRYAACTYCGIFRRYLLNWGARELGATKLAVGHNLNDEVETFVMNLLRGDARRLKQHAPVLDAPAGYFVPRIKPLRAIPVQDVTLYCHYKGYEFQEVPCPYSRQDPILRARVQTFLNDLDQQNHEIKYNLMRVGDELRETLVGATSSSIPATCTACRMPTNPGREVCKTCEIREELGLDLKLELNRG